MLSFRALLMTTVGFCVLALGGPQAARAEKLRGMRELPPSELWSGLADLRTLATGALKGGEQGGHIHIRSTDLSKSAAGVRVLSKLVQCALSNEIKLYLDPIGMEANAVYGRLSLAPEWEERAPNPEAQERVTACMLALLKKERELAINLYTPGGSETANYLVEAKDASFYGNIFSLGAPAFGCVNTGTAKDAEALQQRMCDNQAACTFQQVGMCLGPIPAAQCEPYHPWQRCRDQAAKYWHYPITVTLDKLDE